MDSAAKDTIFHTVQCIAVLCSVVQYSAAQCSAVRELHKVAIAEYAPWGCVLYSAKSASSVGSVANNSRCVNVTMATTANHMSDTKLQKVEFSRRKKLCLYLFRKHFFLTHNLGGGR